jgi:endonuclease/exonuclease/phosphatase (EEP) superfamily protein YafD
VYTVATIPQRLLKDSHMRTHAPQPDRRVLRSLRQIAVRSLLRAAHWGGCATCLATLAGSLGTRWWVFDLLSHFRLHYAVILAICTSGLLLAKPRGRCLMPLAGLLFTLSILWGGSNPVPHIASVAAPTRLLSINVYAGNPRIQTIEDYVQRVDPDLLVLMEITPRWQSALDRLAQRYPHHCVRLSPTPFGIGVFSRLPVETSTVLELGGSGVPAIATRLRHGQQSIELLAVHTMPPISARFSAIRNHQLDDLATHAQRCTVPLIVIGDLNITPWSPWFRQLLDSSRLLDTRNGFGMQPSWPARYRGLGIPIDHCLVSPHCIIDSRSCGPDLGSDHRPVICNFGLNDPDDRPRD